MLQTRNNLIYTTLYVLVSLLWCPAGYTDGHDIHIHVRPDTKQYLSTLAIDHGSGCGGFHTQGTAKKPIEKCVNLGIGGIADNRYFTTI